jgi:hypothetical protein
LNPESQVLLSVGIPTIAVLVGILVNNRQIESLRSEMNARFQATQSMIVSLNETMNARFQAAHEALLRVEGVMDARLKHLEERG